MGKLQFGKDKLRKRVVGLVLEYKAILALTFNLELQDIVAIERIRTQAITQWSRKELEGALAHWTGKVANIRSHYKIRFRREALWKFLADFEDNPDGYLLEVNSFLAAFEDPAILTPQAAEWPLHAKLDLRSPHRDRGFIEVYVIEAEMFESMAAMFNDARRYHQRFKESKEKDRTAGKYTAALYRGSIFAAFGLLESFLNGVAYDYFLSHEETLDEETKGILKDWDFAKNKPRYLSLKDKVGSYQRILLRQKHAPLQASNSLELKYLLEEGIPLRDAHVHPAPGPGKAGSLLGKEQLLLNPNSKVFERIVDSTIAFIQRFAKAIKLPEKRTQWLYERGSDGFFPPEIFDYTLRVDLNETFTPH